MKFSILLGNQVAWRYIVKNQTIQTIFADFALFAVTRIIHRKERQELKVFRIYVKDILFLTLIGLGPKVAVSPIILTGLLISSLLPLLRPCLFTISSLNSSPADLIIIPAHFLYKILLTVPELRRPQSFDNCSGYIRRRYIN